MLGVDIASNLVEAGNKRAKEQGLTNCRFQEGDATNLHELPDQAFDLVVSIFGAMFAPKPFEVAKEMVRVTRPGGRIVMGNWIPNDPTLVAQILEDQLRLHAATAGRLRQPDDVGDREQRDRAICRRGSSRREDLLRPGHVYVQLSQPALRRSLDEFRKYYGPTMNAFEAAEKNGRAADLQKELEVLFNSQNQSPRKDATSIPATFLRVTVAV